MHFVIFGDRALEGGINMRCLISILFFLISHICFSQVIASDDVVICDGQQGDVAVTLTATSFAVDLTDSNIYSDDIFGGVIDMGFDFVFYGNTYSQVVLSSNNYLSFNTANAGGYSGWAINAAVPNNFDAPLNSILCPWQDIYPGVNGNGTIQYATIGEAPNRVFIASFCGIPMFSCTDICYSSQIKLYETTNVIETHIAQKVLCTTWNGGVAIHALHNSDGTIAHPVTGLDGVERNYPNQWTCENDGWRFTPNGDNDYIIENIEFSPAVAGTDIIWQDEFGNQIGTGGEITVFPAGDVTYTAGASLCGSAGDWCGFQGGIEGDDVNITFEELSINGSETDATCYNASDGTIEVLAPNDGDWTYEIYSISTGGGDNSIIGSFLLDSQDSSESIFIFQNLSSGSYAVNIIDNNTECVSEQLVFNLSEPQELTTVTTIINAGCNSDDGSINISISGGTAPFSTIIGNDSGIIDSQDGSELTFNSLAAGNYYFTIIDSNGCLIEGDEEFFTIGVDGVDVSVASAGDDVQICDTQISLSANAALDTESGFWSVIEGQGTIVEFDNESTVVTNLSLGANTFSWTLQNECGTSVDQVTVVVISGDPTISDPGTVYCLDQIPLVVSVQSGEGVWSVNPSEGVYINDPTSLNTFAEVENYGTYVFSFEGCNGGYDSQTINMASEPPVLSGPEVSYCLDDFNLSAEVDGDPGYWEFEGPGNAIFSNQNATSTSVSVDDYGLYTFYYYGCNSVASLQVDMVISSPSIEDPGTIYCVFDTEIYVDSEFEGNWFGSSSEGNSISIENTGENTALVSVSDYGQYQIIFTDQCGISSDPLNLNFTTAQANLIASDHQYCLYNIDLYALVPGDGQSGIWEQISGPSYSEIVDPYSNNTQVIVPEYGVYSFSYSFCDTISYISVGVSCPLNVPNIFSPNSDGVNDIFELVDLNPNIYTQSVFYVYNKWGSVVYNNHNYGLNGDWWDGLTTYSERSTSSIVPSRFLDHNSGYVVDGVYFYTLEVYNTAIQKKEFYSGEIHVFSE